MGLGNPTNAIVSNVIRLTGRTRGTDINISSSVQETPVLPEGIYDVWSTVDCYISTGVSNSGLTTSNGYLLRAGNTVSVELDGENKEKIGVRGTSGVFSFHQVG
jgi:hypothetical protein